MGVLYIWQQTTIYKAQNFYRYDGSTEECGLAEGATGSAGSDPKSLFVNGTDLYLTAYTDAVGREVFTSTNFTDITSGLKTAQVSKVSIFPNPAQEYVTVSSVIPIQKLSLFSEIGNEITSVNYATLRINQYTAGVYYLKIELNNQETLFQKLIITK